MWGYKCHKVLGWFLYPVIHFCHFFLELSWHYAHYSNGWFVTGSKDWPKNPPDTFFKDKSFWWAVKSSWHSRKGED